MVSRTGKAIPNRWIQKECKGVKEGCDGELICGDFGETTSAVMSVDGMPYFTYCIFDRVCKGGYEERVKGLDVLIYEVVGSEEELLRLEEKWVGKACYEGIILRNPEARYKHGRSTMREGGLMKLKRFKEREAEIIGFEEERSVDGRLKGVLGALIVRDKVEFKIGTGFKLVDRKWIWEDKDKYKGAMIKYRYMDSVKDKPRFPVYVGVRWKEDM